MSGFDRRSFIRMMGSMGMAAALPAGIERALAIPADRRTGSINDVEHIVILMQENRSFDHYFGTLRGVRGFADPRAVTLPSGQSVWYQPDAAGTGYVLPYRPDVDDVGMTFLADPPHNWTDTHAAWNAGRYDRWIRNKGVTTMAYHTRHDLPYYYALADAFTVCDNYHCSLMGSTNPNRYHMWTGWTGNDGRGGGPAITNFVPGFDWSTYPERLQRAGLTWKIYQDAGVGLTAAGGWGWTEDPYIGNYGDNALLYFRQYQNAPPGTPLADNAKTGTNILAQDRDPERLLDIFRDDLRQGALPQVSWIVAPEAYSEHPNWAPGYGSWYVSQVIDILSSHPRVWSRTVLFITFDEEGGFFDHLVPPTPPPSPAQGLSTVPAADEIYPGNVLFPRGPYGFGVRVPMIVVSPWSKGGWVNSQLFDHTSLIRFLEARFADGNPDLIETNITPWRRAVAGDLTTAFDFRKPEAWRRLRLPDTDAFEPDELVRHPTDVVLPPGDQTLPRQERGVRPARALPYVLHAHGAVDSDDGSFHILFINAGHAAAVFHVRSGNAADAPRTFTLEAQTQLVDAWSITSAGAATYDLAVHGPNGFFRAFRGGIDGGRAVVDIGVSYDERRTGITITASSRTKRLLTIRILDAYSGRSLERELDPGESISRYSSRARFGAWYDFVITVVEDAGFEWRLAGHIETGSDSISDPAMGGVA